MPTAYCLHESAYPTHPPAEGTTTLTGITDEHRHWLADTIARLNAVALLTDQLGATVIGETTP